MTWIQLNLQLLRLTGDAKFANQIETSLYNHSNSGTGAMIGGPFVLVYDEKLDPERTCSSHLTGKVRTRSQYSSESELSAA